MECALLNREETTLSWQLVWCLELYCRYQPVCVGFLCTSTEIFPLLCFNEVSGNSSSALLSSSKLNLMFWWRILMWWKEFSKCIRMRINVINKFFINFWRVWCLRYCNLFMLKMLVLPMQRHQFVGKTENEKATEWWFKPD